MDKLKVGVVFQVKEIYFYNKYINIYKPINYGYCKDDDTGEKLIFYSGKYAGQELFKSDTYGNFDICAERFYDFTDFLKYGFSYIDVEIKKWYKKIINHYYIIEKNEFMHITDEILINKCKNMFMSDESEYIELQKDDNLFGDFDSDENEYSENSFLQYDIEEKYKTLKEYVYGQDEQLKQILTCIIKNIELTNSMYPMDEISNLKSNILLLGQTGVGKTLITKQICKLFNIPYVLEDATRYTRNGWAGEDIENMLRNLYIASGESLTRAESGILIIDEFDKLCNRNEHSDISTTSVQQGLLKLIEGTKINISKNNHTNVGNFIFDTSKLTILLLGSFDGIDKIIQKRTDVKKIGFNNINETTIDKNIQIEDLIEYGVITEIAGRMSNIIELNKPNENDLKNAFLHSKSSSLMLLQKYLEDRGIKVEFDETFIDILVKKAVTLKTGYRALNQILNTVVENEMFDIMANKKKVLSLTSDKVK